MLSAPSPARLRPSRTDPPDPPQMQIDRREANRLLSTALAHVQGDRPTDAQVFAQALAEMLAEYITTCRVRKEAADRAADAQIHESERAP